MPHSPPGQLLHQVAGAGVRIITVEMISTRTSKVINRVPEGPTGEVELEVLVMFEGEAVKATFILHQYEMRLRLLMRLTEVRFLYADG